MLVEYDNMKIFKNLNMNINIIANTQIKCQRCNKIYKIWDYPTKYPNRVSTNDVDSDYKLKR